MPLKKQSFELLLKSDPKIQFSALEKIRLQFGPAPKPIYPQTSNPYFKDFFQIDLQTSRNKWDIIREIMSVDGVIEADPIEKVLGIFNKAKDHDNLDQDPQWNHKITNFPDAINFSKEQGTLEQDTSVKIIQLDTGYTEHPEIQEVKSDLGVNFIQGEDHRSPLDLLNHNILQQPGHGTATASVIIGNETTRKDDKNLGVFPYVDLVPFRIAKSVVHFWNSHIGAAVKAAVDSGADIITMSMGGAPPRASWRRAAQYAYKNGVIFICAAGNQVKFVVWPARYNKVIGVAGINNEGLPWEGSCRGRKVQVSAPGENVFVARVLEDGKYHYSYGSGTSYATPHVAAAAALWLNHFKSDLEQEAFQLRPDLKVEAFKWALMTSARTPSDWDEKTKEGFGAGILDARKLLDYSPIDFFKNNPDLISRGPDEELDPEEELFTPEQKELCQLILTSEKEDIAEFANDVVGQASESSTEAFSGIARDVLSGDRGENTSEMNISDLKNDLLETLLKN